MAKGGKLTPKQQRFVDEYLIDLNSTQAAIRAGYSAKTANVIGSENLAKPYIQSAVQQAQAKQQERTLITADAVLKNIIRISAKAEEMEKLSDALKGNELLGRHLKMFTDKFESTEKTENKVEISFSPESNELLKEIAANASSRG